jgi:hypothetical protein
MLGEQTDPMRSKDCIHPQVVARAISDFANRETVFFLPREPAPQSMLTTGRSA